MGRPALRAEHGIGQPNDPPVDTITLARCPWNDLSREQRGMAAIDWFDLAQHVTRGELNAVAVDALLTDWGVHRLQAWLVDHGLVADALPNEPAVLAQLVRLYSFPEISPAATDAEATGEAAMPPQLRYVKVTTHGAESRLSVFAAYSHGGALRLEEEYSSPLSTEDTPRHLSQPDSATSENGSPQPHAPANGEPHAPDEPPHTPQDTPHTPHTPETPSTVGTTRHHHRINVKLVMWIPYFPNNLPLVNKIMPWWRGDMTFSQDLAMRFLMATGNPPPPSGFPKACDFDSYVKTKEYRGIISFDLLICCTADDRMISYNTTLPAYIGGYTPSFSGVPEGGLHADHDATEDLASEIERAIQDAATDAEIAAIYGKAGIGLPGSILPLIPYIRKIGQRPDRQHPKEPESYTPGQAIHDEDLIASVAGDCQAGWAKMGIQVNRMDNILYYALTKRLLPYMWGRLDFKLCCTGLFTITGIGSSIPNKTLYINNVAVSQFDMTQLTFAEIKESVPLDPPTDESDKKYLDDPATIQPQYAPPLGSPANRIQVQHTRTVPPVDGCPAPSSLEWLYDGPPPAPVPPSGH